MLLGRVKSVLMISRIAIFCFIAIVFTASAEETAAQDNLPRWGSLKSNEVNVRAGPGTQYPIEWVFVRESLPVEIIAKFDNWLRIRDMDRTEGWIHQNLLSRNRFAMIIENRAVLMRAPELDGVPIAVIEPYVIAQVLRCREDWCRLHVDGHTGWLLRTQIWGVYPHEELD